MRTKQKSGKEKLRECEWKLGIEIITNDKGTNWKKIKVRKRIRGKERQTARGDTQEAEDGGGSGGRGKRKERKDRRKREEEEKENEDKKYSERRE